MFSVNDNSLEEFINNVRSAQTTKIKFKLVKNTTKKELNSLFVVFYIIKAKKRS